MSDALPLVPRPNLAQYKKLAKDFQRAANSGDSQAFRRCAERLAQTLARLYARPMTPAVETEIRHDAERMDRQRAAVEKSKSTAWSLADAQFFLARCHGFTSWPKFARHVEAIATANSPASQFEAAADAVVEGKIPALQNLLRANPELVRLRSTREHRSTLLHYVSANGVEDFRQKTPANILELAKILLDAGADVNAESDAYGGHSTTLHLTATSCHPEAAGVQLALMDLLIQRGALIDPPDGAGIVNSCLHNGRGEAAEYLAGRGAKLDLEAAAGVGRLDLVQAFFKDGSLAPPATSKQMTNGFAWACEFGRTAVVDFLLQRGMAIDARLPHNRQTGLHWAAYGGHADTAKLLLERGAAVDATDESFGGTPLEWALYQWGNSPYWAARGAYYETVALLARAGASLYPDWFNADDDERSRAVRKLRSDPRMQSALRGGLPL